MIVNKIDLDYIEHHEKDMLRTAREHKVILKDGAEWLTGNTLASVHGIPILLRLDAAHHDILWLDKIYEAAINYKWAEGGIKRLHTGAGYTGVSFGTAERKEIRRRMGVGRTQFSQDNESFSNTLEIMVEKAWAYIKEYGEDFYYQVDSAPKALECWRIRTTPYTSGVVNASVTMPYHRDRGNVANTGSVMWVVRKYVNGGHLHIPELNVVVDCKHGTMLAFYGEMFWHGVTLISGLSRKQAGRFSIVSYAKHSILNAATPEEENYNAMVRGTKSFDHKRETALKYD